MPRAIEDGLDDEQFAAAHVAHLDVFPIKLTEDRHHLIAAARPDLDAYLLHRRVELRRGGETVRHQTGDRWTGQRADRRRGFRERSVRLRRDVERIVMDLE